MAVYYKWIKGCEIGSSLDSGLWTYLKWGNGDLGTSVNNLPHIYTSTGKVDNPTNDLGYILTNAATGIEITQPWKLSNDFYFDLNSHTNNNNNLFLSDSCGNIQLIDGGYYFKKNLTINGTAILNSTLSVTGATTLKSTLDVTGATTLKSTLNVTGATTLKSTLDVTGAIETKSSCTAVYFNATSDKRAKENIRPANYSALDLIKKLPVYIYNYKNSNETVTGILAQDLLEVQPKELNLVSNINATGENNDYMSIKNDKLMFVLMKAIQEQQEQIEQLKSEIDNIKKSY